MVGTSNTTHLERTVNALAMIAPLALGVRFEGLTHCVEASVCGALALKRFKLAATAIPCAAVAFDPMAGEHGGAVCIGHTPRSVYDWHLRNGEVDMPPFEEWKADKDIPDDDPLHMVIEAKHCGKRALIDLTAGQARVKSNGQVRVPNVVLGRGEGWPRLSLESGGWIEYGPSPRKGPAIWRDYTNPGLVGDMIDLMTLALECRLNPRVLAAQISGRLRLLPGPNDPVTPAA